MPFPTDLQTDHNPLPSLALRLTCCIVASLRAAGAGGLVAWGWVCDWAGLAQQKTPAVGSPAGAGDEVRCQTLVEPAGCGLVADPLGDTGRMSQQRQEF